MKRYGYLKLLGFIFGVLTVAVSRILLKWIFGVLAVALFCIWGIKYYEEKRKLENKLKALFESYDQDRIKRMNELSKRRDVLFEAQRPDDDDYGYSPSNPIMTSSVFSNDKYLDKLQTMDGKRFAWRRTGSMYYSELHGVESVAVDCYELMVDGEFHKKVYICPYGHNSNYVPKGMKLGE